jgi:hypothetical protein
MICFRETIVSWLKQLVLNARYLMTDYRKDIAVFVTQPICAPGDLNIANYLKKHAKKLTLDLMLMFTLDAKKLSESLAKYAKTKKPKNTMKITTNRLTLNGCAAVVI